VRQDGRPEANYAGHENRSGPAERGERLFHRGDPMTSLKLPVRNSPPSSGSGTLAAANV
jgi:hypothetical protein